jgi:hypothetical protein
MPAVTTTPQFLLASNLSAVYVKTQSALGVWDDPTPAVSPPTTPATYVGTNAIRVLGTPKFSVRGAGIIQRADQNTPWGGNQSSKTGGLGWDITLSTEFFWELGAPLDLTLASLTQLAPLWLASPWSITNQGGGIERLAVQPLFYAEEDRNTADFAVQPFSIAYEETGGKRFEAYDCVCVPKVSWEYGQRVMIEWTIKGKWRPVTTSYGVTPDYVAVADQSPLIGVNCALDLTNFFENVNAVSKVTIDTGWTITDVADFRETYGFGLGFISLAASPSIEVDVADLPEGPSTSYDPGPPPTYVPTGQEPDWTDAQANTINSTALTLTLTVGGYTITFYLSNPQLVAFPTPGETNSYRTNTLKFQGIPDSTSPVMNWDFTQTTP